MWIDQGPTEWSGQIALTAGQRYDIRMEFYENGGGAMARLRWSSSSQAKQIIPQTRLYLPGSSSQAEVNWLVADQLGTPRMIFDKTGSLANTKRHDYLPFGEELFALVGGRTTTQGYSADTLRQQFTQKERDIETGLDYFGARYYSSIQGRFTSADPIFLTASRLYDSQRLTLYNYSRNNPLKYLDPNGKDIRIDPKLSKGDADKLFKLATAAYTRKLGKDALTKAKESKIMFEFTVGSILGETRFGSTVIHPVGSEDKGKVVALDQSKTLVVVTIDVAKIDSNNKDQSKPEILTQNVFNNELYHVKSTAEDPLKATNIGQGREGEAAYIDEEEKSDAFEKALGAQGIDTERYPDPESLDRAESEVRKLFSPQTEAKPPTEEKKKRP